MASEASNQHIKILTKELYHVLLIVFFVNDKNMFIF